MNVFQFRVLLIILLVIIVLIGVDLALANTLELTSLPMLLYLHTQGWIITSLIDGENAEQLLLTVEHDKDAFHLSMAQVFSGVLTVPIALAAFLGLFLLRTWGAWCLLFLVVLELVGNPLLSFSPTAFTTWGILLGNIHAFLYGVLLTAVFVGPMRHHFFLDRQTRVY